MTDERTISIGKLELASGVRLRGVEQRVTVYGKPAADGSNVVLVEHALTGSSRAHEWWPGIVGSGALFDPKRWCIIAINALGSCYGSTCPASRITVRDIVRAEQRALTQLGIDRIRFVIGGSLGGMRALQWAIDAPERVQTSFVVGAHDHHSALGIALNSLQRDALALDPQRGLRLARKIAMLTYKSDELLTSRHGRRPDRLGRPLFDVEGYLEHQADLFEGRMDAASYAALTHAMDSFDVRSFDIPATKPELIFVGITSDWLFRAQDVRAAARRFELRGFPSRYVQLASSHGHDAFLAEPEVLRVLLEPYLRDATHAAAVAR
ncbi:MAG: alpha/beta fold hydrolase [Candidatus Eremiobacteraeota bacterium]|nr:alpha/beta fold hydrolase [Candidatus Eremiobacteraeota bacterium]